MTDVIPIAQLRQNPAPALKAVSEGRTLVVTSHNRPVADLVPHVERRGVSPADFTEALIRTRVDSAWAAEVEAGRAALEYGRIVRASVAGGKGARSNVLDRMIAAIARANGLTLATRNVVDLRDVTRLVDVIEV